MDILVAQSKEDPDVTVGYLCYEKPNTIHYIYTRHQFNGFGVGRALIKASGIDMSDFNYSHRTKDCCWLVGFTKRIDNGAGIFDRIFVAGKYPGGVYSPYGFLRGWHYD